MSSSCIKLGPVPNHKSVNNVVQGILCSNLDGSVLAYGCCQNAVAFLSLKDYLQTSCPQYLGMFTVFGQREKVTNVAFCRDAKRANRLLTSSEGGSLKIWDVDLSDINSPSLLDELTGIDKIICADWTGKVSDQVLCCDDKGTILLWNCSIKKKAIKLTFHVKGQALIVSPSPSDASIAAIGYKGGLIAIVNINKGEIIQKFRGHQDDVVSFSWCTKIDPQECDLASSSLDKTIRVWSVRKGRMIGTISTPSARSKGAKDKNHLVPISWLPDSENEILYGTFRGDIVSVKFDEVGQNYVQENLYSQQDSTKPKRCIFNVITGGSSSNAFACSISLDKNIAIWDLNSKKAIHSIPTIGGFVYGITWSLLHPYKVLLGVGDNVLRILDVTNDTGPPKLDTYWTASTGKVTAVAWHPDIDDVFAFGTSEGKVGIFNPRYTKAVEFSKIQHGDTVYSLSWGPLHTKADKDFADGDKISLHLYSCGDSRIFIYNLNALSRKIIDFDDIAMVQNTRKRPQRCEIAWKPDFTALAVGNMSGTVEIYDRELNFLACLDAQKKMVQSLRWHHLHTMADADSHSPLHCYLACASNDTAVNVYDLTQVLAASRSVEPDNKEASRVVHPFRQLRGHREAVSCVAWSLHKEGILASSSYDGTAKVWDVCSGKLLSSYEGHLYRLFAVEWNPLHPDFVITGGNDNCIQEWSVSKHAYSPDRVVRNETTKKKSGLNGSSSNGLPLPSAKQDHVEKLPDLLENGFQEAQQVKPVSVAKSSSSSGKETHPQSIGGSSEAKKTRANPSLFPLSSSNECRGKSHTLNDLLLLTHHHFPDGYFQNEKLKEESQLMGKDSYCHLGLYGDQAATVQLLDTEANNHKKAGKIDLSFQLEVWKGDIGDALREAANKNLLNDTMLALAPLGSRALWLEMCEKYAEQLLSEKLFHKAAMYLLACHKVYEAIQVLVDNQAYREALVLAKTRLPPSDPLIQELMIKWAQASETSGQIDSATKCYVALKDHQTASKLLAKRTDPGLQKAAAYIALHCNRHEEAFQYSVLCLRNCLQKNSWDVAQQLIKEQTRFKPCHLLIFVHQSLANFILEKDNTADARSDPVAQGDNEDRGVKFWNATLVAGKKFVDIVYEECASNMEQSNDKDFIQNAVKLISEVSHDSSFTTKEILIQLARHLVFAQLELLKENCENSLVSYALNLSRALALSHESKIFHSVCSLLFPTELCVTEQMREQLYEDILLPRDKAWHCVEPWIELLSSCFPKDFAKKLMGQCSSSLSYERNLSYTHIQSILAYFCLDLLNKISDVLREQSNCSECKAHEMGDALDIMIEENREVVPLNGLVPSQNECSEMNAFLTSLIGDNNAEKCDSLDNGLIDKDIHLEFTESSSIESPVSRDDNEDFISDAKQMDEVLLKLEEVGLTSEIAGDESSKSEELSIKNENGEVKDNDIKVDSSHVASEEIGLENNQSNLLANLVKNHDHRMSCSTSKYAADLPALLCGVVPILLNDLYAELALHQCMLMKIDEAVARKVAAHICQQRQASQSTNKTDEEATSHAPENTMATDTGGTSYEQKTISELQMLKQSVTEKMSLAREQIQDIPFPNPLSSAKKIIEMCRIAASIPCYLQVKFYLEKMACEVAAWALPFCDSESDKQQFIHCTIK